MEQRCQRPRHRLTWRQRSVVSVSTLIHTQVYFAAAIYSVVSFLACVAPRLTFQLYGIIPIPAWLAVAGIFTYDTYSAIKDKVSLIQLPLFVLEQFKYF